jgi:hypothetical protein
MAAKPQAWSDVGNNQRHIPNKVLWNYSSGGKLKKGNVTGGRITHAVQTEQVFATTLQGIPVVEAAAALLEKQLKPKGNC